jgi:hypothetical protein
MPLFAAFVGGGQALHECTKAGTDVFQRGLVPLN